MSIFFIIIIVPSKNRSLLWFEKKKLNKSIPLAEMRLEIRITIQIGSFPLKDT